MSGSHDPRDLSHTLSHSALAAHTHTHTHAERKLKAERREQTPKKGTKDGRKRALERMLIFCYKRTSLRGTEAL